jgi:hypothetical protein
MTGKGGKGSLIRNLCFKRNDWLVRTFFLGRKLSQGEGPITLIVPQ